MLAEATGDQVVADEHLRPWVAAAGVTFLTSPLGPIHWTRPFASTVTLTR
jgi:hypothetical protein